MNSLQTHRSGRLRGRCLLMSADIPPNERNERYPRVDDAHLKIDEAIISLARAVFFEEGNLVFSDRPSNTSLVAMIAGEYREPRFAEGEGMEERESGNAIVYKSSISENDLPDETQLLESLGYLTVRRGDENLRSMRTSMIQESQPIAMVCIGGMEDMEEELELFNEFRRGAPIYVIATTGGSAALIAREKQQDIQNIRVIDREIMAELQQIIRELPSTNELGEGFELRYTPYALIMQKIIDDLINPNSNSSVY